MKKILLCCFVVIICFDFSYAQSDTDQNPPSKDERMAWWRDAKFGMFIHWGAYAIPGGERNGEICRGGAEWVMDKLDYTVEDYENEVVAQFNPEKFNADDWVAMAKDAGMKYIVLTSKHHDGFCLWDSKVTDYDIMDATPFKRDIVKELAEACKKEGIKFCFYHSIVDWHHPQAQAPLYPNYNAGQKDQSVFNPEFPQYFENYLKPQIAELLTNYGDIGVVWFDGDWIPDYTTEMGKEMYDYIMDLQPNTIVNNRVDKGRMGMEGMDKEGDFAGDFGTPEQEIPATGIDSDWESCMTMNGSWGYKPSDHNWKSSKVLIQNLVDIVSKGGNFLLNVGPDAEGLFPPESVERLRAIGEWTKANGESIYGAKASPYDRPDWGRFTSKQGLLYAHIFDWPEDSRIQISNDVKVTKAYLLVEPDKELEIMTSDSGDIILLPEEAPDSSATVIKIETIPSEDWANLHRYDKANAEVGLPSANEDRVVFMGNSITQGWVRNDPDFFSSNAYIGRGISGQTTAQMLIRFRPDVIDLKPKAVVILAGTNDIAANNGPVTLENTAGNIFSMVELAQANGIKVVLSSALPADRYSWRPAIYPADKIIELNKLIKAYAEKHDIVYLDYYSPMVNDQKGLKKEYSKDGVHPTLEGFKVMEPLVQKAIKKALKY